jgi:hypothetical protein
MRSISQPPSARRPAAEIGATVGLSVLGRYLYESEAKMTLSVEPLSSRAGADVLALIGRDRVDASGARRLARRQDRCPRTSLARKTRTRTRPRTRHPHHLMYGWSSRATREKKRSAACRTCCRSMPAARQSQEDSSRHRDRCEGECPKLLDQSAARVITRQLPVQQVDSSRKPSAPRSSRIACKTPQPSTPKVHGQREKAFSERDTASDPAQRRSPLRYRIT